MVQIKPELARQNVLVQCGKKQPGQEIVRAEL